MLLGQGVDIQENTAKRRNEHHGISANLQCLRRIRSPLQVFLPSDPSRPLQLTAQLISTNCRCHRLLLGIGTIMPGGWWLPQPPPPPPSDQTQTPRCGYAIFLAAFHGRSQFLGRPLGTLSKTAYTEAQIRNRTLRRAHAGRGAKLHARSLPLPPPPCSSVHSMVRQGAPNLWLYHYGANTRTTHSIMKT